MSDDIHDEDDLDEEVVAPNATTAIRLGRGTKVAKAEEIIRLNPEKNASEILTICHGLGYDISIATIHVAFKNINGGSVSRSVKKQSKEKIDIHEAIRIFKLISQEAGEVSSSLAKLSEAVMSVRKWMDEMKCGNLEELDGKISDLVSLSLLMNNK